MCMSMRLCVVSPCVMRHIQLRCVIGNCVDEGWGWIIKHVICNAVYSILVPTKKKKKVHNVLCSLFDDIGKLNHVLALTGTFYGHTFIFCWQLTHMFLGYEFHFDEKLEHEIEREAFFARKHRLNDFLSHERRKEYYIFTFAGQSRTSNIPSRVSKQTIFTDKKERKKTPLTFRMEIDSKRATDVFKCTQCTYHI